MLRYSACLGVTALVLAASPARAQQTPPAWPYAFLDKVARLTPAEMEEVNQGKVVTKLLPSQVKYEVATFGVMRLDLPREFFLERDRDIEEFRKSASILQVKKFSSVPKVEDLAALSLEPQDIESLKKCKLHRCDWRLTAEALERFQKEINWAAPDAAGQASALMRNVLLGRLQAFLSSGDAALGHYDDKKASLDVSAEFNSILDQSPYLAANVPEIERYLRTGPQTSLPNTENFSFWSKEKYGFGLKTVITITNTSIYKQQSSAGAPLIITSKQIFASHYFDASLGVALLLDATEDKAAPRCYLIYLNRTRVDALRSSFAFLIRGIIARNIRSQTKDIMAALKLKLEAQYRAASVPGAVHTP
jgi:hypothetical protein